MTQKKEKRTFLAGSNGPATRYFIRAMSSMALGLFSSLIIGLILSQLSKLPFLSWLAPFAEVVSASSPVVVFGHWRGGGTRSGCKAAGDVFFCRDGCGGV